MSNGVRDRVWNSVGSGPGEEKRLRGSSSRTEDESVLFSIAVLESAVSSMRVASVLFLEGIGRAMGGVETGWLSHIIWVVVGEDAKATELGREVIAVKLSEESEVTRD